MARSNIQLSIIVPAFDEATAIGDTLDTLAAYIAAHPALRPCELVVVAAGTDATASITRQYRNRFDALQVITPAGRRGKGRDVRAGFQAARGRLQLFTDADLSTPVRHISEMVSLLDADSDIVIGARPLWKIHHGLLRTLLSLCSSWLVRGLLLRGIRDSQCGFKGFRADAARALFTDDRRIDGWAFDIEILAAARQHKYHITQMDIDDWHETRADDLRNEGLGRAALITLRDTLWLRTLLWLLVLERHLYYVIAAVAAGSFGLTLWFGSQQSIWFDEGYSAALIQHSFARIIQLTSVDVHPPLYYLLLKIWTDVFGSQDVALRSFSALCSALAVAVGLLLVKRLWDRRIALAAAPFALAAPFVIRYGYEVRMYALSSLLCISATYVLVAALQAKGKQRRWLWITYALLVTAGMYTLYYTALVWMAHLIWCIYLSRSAKPRTPWKQLVRQPWFTAYASAFVLFLGWVPFFIRQLHSVQSSFWISPATYQRVVSVWSFFFSYLADWELTPWWSLLFMAALVSALYFIITAFRVSDRAHQRSLALLALYATVPVILLYCASLPPLQPVFVERYVSQAILGAYLLVGVAIATVLRYRRTVFAGLLALVMLAVFAQGVFTLQQVGNMHTPEIRPAAAYLQGNTLADQPIVTNGAYDYIPFRHYLPHAALYFYSPQPAPTTGGYAMLHGSPWRVSSSSAFPHEAVWVVYSGQTAPYVPRNHRISRSAHAGGYEIRLYTVAPPAAGPATGSTLHVHAL